MVRYSITQDSVLRAEQIDLSPAVYLDHWALRKISEDRALSEQFIASVKARGGTLMLSWLNLAEFTQVADISQFKKAESLIEGMLPNIYFMETNPFTVLDRENALLAGGHLAPPYADKNFLEIFCNLQSKSLSPFTACGLFTPLHQSDAVSGFIDLGETMIKKIEGLS